MVPTYVRWLTQEIQTALEDHKVAKKLKCLNRCTYQIHLRSRNPIRILLIRDYEIISYVEENGSLLNFEEIAFFVP